MPQLAYLSKWVIIFLIWRLWRTPQVQELPDSLMSTRHEKVCLLVICSRKQGLNCERVEGEEGPHNRGSCWYAASGGLSRD